MTEGNRETGSSSPTCAKYTNSSTNPVNIVLKGRQMFSADQQLIYNNPSNSYLTNWVTFRKPSAKEKEMMPIRTHMHKEPPSFVDRFTGYAETAGKVYSAASTLYHVGRAVGTAARCAASLLGFL